MPIKTVSGTESSSASGAVAPPSRAAHSTPPDVSPQPPVPMVFFGDPVTAALAAIAELARDERKMHQQQAAVEANTAENAAEQQARSLEDKADATRTGAWVSAGLIGGSAVATELRASEMSELSDPPKPAAGAAETRWAGAKEASLAAADIPTRLADARGYECDATKARAEGAQKAAEARQDGYGDAASAAAELAQKALAAVQAVADARNAAMSAAIMGTGRG